MSLYEFHLKRELLIHRFDLDFAEWVVEIGWYTYWNAMYVVMVAMLLHTLNSLLLYYATITESTSLLIVNMILRFVKR